jgi:hypothetical protein
MRPVVNVSRQHPALGGLNAEGKTHCRGLLIDDV